MSASDASGVLTAAGSVCSLLTPSGKAAAESPVSDSSGRAAADSSLESGSWTSGMELSVNDISKKKSRMNNYL